MQQSIFISLLEIKILISFSFFLINNLSLLVAIIESHRDCSAYKQFLNKRNKSHFYIVM